MKKTLFILAAMLVATAAAAENEIGIYLTETETTEENACYSGGPGQFTAYVVLTDPVNLNTSTPMANVGGFEFKMIYDPTLFVTPTLHPSATNFMSPPNFFCGANIPVVGGQCTLITLTIGTFDTNPRSWFLEPVDDNPSVPGAIAITDADDNFSISEAYTSSGDFLNPVFGMWTCPVPNEDVTFGGVKALYQ